MDGGFLLCDREIMMDSTNPQSRVLRVPDSEGEVLCQERARDKRALPPSARVQQLQDFQHSYMTLIAEREPRAHTSNSYENFGWPVFRLFAKSIVSYHIVFPCIRELQRL